MIHWQQWQVRASSSNRCDLHPVSLAARIVGSHWQGPGDRATDSEKALPRSRRGRRCSCQKAGGAWPQATGHNTFLAVRPTNGRQAGPASSSAYLHCKMWAAKCLAASQKALSFCAPQCQPFSFLPTWKLFGSVTVRNFATSRNIPPPSVREPTKAPGQSKLDERSQVQNFLDSLPPQGIAVNLHPGNDLESAEKRLRRKVNQEGILLKYREAKVLY